MLPERHFMVIAIGNYLSPIIYKALTFIGQTIRQRLKEDWMLISSAHHLIVLWIVYHVYLLNVNLDLLIRRCFES